MLFLKLAFLVAALVFFVVSVANIMKWTHGAKTLEINSEFLYRSVGLLVIGVLMLVYVLLGYPH